MGAEFHKFGCNGENFDGSYFGHLWLWPREGAQLTAAHVVPSRTEMEYKGGLSEAAVSDELIVESLKKGFARPPSDSKSSFILAFMRVRQ